MNNPDMLEYWKEKRLHEMYLNFDKSYKREEVKCMPYAIKFKDLVITVNNKTGEALENSDRPKTDVHELLKSGNYNQHINELKFEIVKI